MEEIFICKYCGKLCKNLNSLKNHEIRCKKNPNRIKINNNFKNYNLKIHKNGGGWNKGLTKNTDERIAKSVDTYKKNKEKGLHKKPSGRAKTEEAELERRRKISEKAKILRSLGIGCNLNKCRKNKEHSYPEKWLIKVLKNNFGMEENIDYNTEVFYKGYWLDFCWEESKLVIEIDGEQHVFNEDQVKRDKKKDELLKEDGYKELRIPWSDCYRYTQKWINIIYNFLNKNPEEIARKNREFIKKRNEILLKEKEEYEKIPVNKRGFHTKSIITEEKWKERKNLILSINNNNNDIDLMHPKFAEKISSYIDLSPGIIKTTLEKFNINHYKLNSIDRTKENEEYLKTGPHYCEKCGKLIENKYGSGRFCSQKCANTRSHSDKEKQKIKNSMKKYHKKK